MEVEKMSYDNNMTIAEVVNDIYSNKYVLPAIQREFVWKPEQIEKMFDSIMQDYPIGTFLFWNLADDDESKQSYVFYSFLKNYHEKNKRHNEIIDLKGIHGVRAVLDGQQRLTALYIGLKGSYASKIRYRHWEDKNAFPEKKLFLNLVQHCRVNDNQFDESYTDEQKTAEDSFVEQNVEKDSDSKYEFKFLVPDEAAKLNDKDNYWFEVGRILEVRDSKAISEITNKQMSKVHKYDSETINSARDILCDLRDRINVYKTICSYVEKSDDLDKVLNIFIRVNSGGTVLSYSDLLLSIASAQWSSNAREEITKFVDEINAIGDGYNVNKDFIMKSALVFTNKKIAFKIDNFKKKDMLKIEENWTSLKKYLKLAFELIYSFGITRDSLTANNAVIPIAYYLRMVQAQNNFITSSNQKDNRDRIKKWLILSLYKRAFGGQPDSVLKAIRKILNHNKTKEFPIGEIIAKFSGGPKSIIINKEDIDEILSLKYGRSDVGPILMLLYPSFKFEVHKFHVDHIYPKSAYKKDILIKKGVKLDNVNDYIAHVDDLANLQLLLSTTNEEKQNMDFDEWFNKEFRTDDEKNQNRKINYLPKMDYSYVNFKDFLEKRKDLLRKQLCLIFNLV